MKINAEVEIYGRIKRMPPLGRLEREKFGIPAGGGRRIDASVRLKDSIAKCFGKDQGKNKFFFKFPWKKIIAGPKITKKL
jgi:hypothetical protein